MSSNASEIITKQQLLDAWEKHRHVGRVAAELGLHQSTAGVALRRAGVDTSRSRRRSRVVFDEVDA